MAQLRDGYDQIRSRQAEVLVAGPEAQEAFAAYWRKHRLPFVGLPDPGHRVLKLYGQQVKLFKLGRLPAQVIVDQRGTVRYAHYGHSMADIPAMSSISTILDQLNLHEAP